MSGSRSAVLGGFILSVLLHVCVGELTVEVVPSSPKAGDTVTLHVRGVSEKIVIASWYKGPSTKSSDQILSHVNGIDIKGERYFSQASCRDDGALVIKDYREEFSGEYTVQIQTSTTLQDGRVTVNGVSSMVFSPLTLLLGLLLYFSISYL